MRTTKTQTHGSRQKVLEYINARKRPATITDVAGAVGITEKAAGIQLSRLTTSGEISRPERGKFLPKSGKAASTAPAAPASLEAVQAKLAELVQERRGIDAKISALETTMQILGHRARKARGAITEAQWAEIGRKVTK